MDGMLHHLEKLLNVKNIFVRNRKKRRTREHGIILYHYEFSIRKYKIILPFFEDISYISIRQWYQKKDYIFTLDT